MVLLDALADPEVVRTGGMIGIVVAVGFFLVLAAVAYIAFKALKKTAKMAFRMAIVVVILIIAIIGSASLWYFSSDVGTQKPRPANRRR